MFIRELPTSVKTGIILVGIIVILWLAYLLSSVIAPFLLSLVSAYILNPVVRSLEKRGLPRVWATITIYVSIFILSVILIIPLGFMLVGELNDLLASLSRVDIKNMTREYQAWLQNLSEKHLGSQGINSWLHISAIDAQKIGEFTAKALLALKETAATLLQKLLSLIISAFGGVIDLFLIPLLTFYMLVDFDLIRRCFIEAVPPIYRGSACRIADNIDCLLSRFLHGQLICACVFAVLMTFGLWLARMPFAFLLGPMAGIGNLVPYLGSLITIIFAIIIALITCGLSANTFFVLLKAGAALAIVQTLDGFVVQPYVMQENLGMHPLTIMLVLVIGGNVFGFWGMLLAVPAACVIKVIGGELYHELYDAA